MKSLPSPWTLLLAGAALSAALSFGSTARAEAPQAPPPRSTSVTLRSEGLGLRAEGLGIGGLSGTLRLGSFEVGAGAAVWASICSVPVVPTGRLGLSFEEAPPKGHAGWELRVPLLAEYSYFNKRNSGCDMRASERVHAFALQSGLDATRWGEGSLGFNLRILGFAGPTLFSTGEAYESANGPLRGGITGGAVFSIGLAIATD